MVKNIVITLLVIVILGESGYIFVKKAQTQNTSEMTQQPIVKVNPSMPPARPSARGGKLVILSKGMNLKTSPLYKYAYQVVPGPLSDSAKKAITGFSVTSTTQQDGSISVSFIPKDSDNQSQQYTVKSGQLLYYIEQTPIDDKGVQDKDLNYRDDYGIITDMNGIIQ